MRKDAEASPARTRRCLRAPRARSHRTETARRDHRRDRFADDAAKLFNAQDALSLARYQRLAALVSLFQALGGGFTRDPLPDWRTTPAIAGCNAMRKLIALILIVAAARRLCALPPLGRHCPFAFCRDRRLRKARTPAVPRFGFGRAQQQSRERPAVPVLAARARSEDVPVTADAAGTIQALNTATVRAQVEGRLSKSSSRKDRTCRQAMCCTHRSRTYQAQYDQLSRKLAQDSAQLANARLDLERYIRLAATNSGSKQQADTQRALVAQLEAQLKVNSGACRRGEKRSSISPRSARPFRAHGHTPRLTPVISYALAMRRGW